MPRGPVRFLIFLPALLGTGLIALIAFSQGESRQPERAAGTRQPAAATEVVREPARLAGNPARRPAAAPRADWSHQELCDYLAARGLQFEKGTARGKYPSVWLFQGGNARAANKSKNLREYGAQPAFYFSDSSGTVLCQKLPSAQEAKDQAGTATRRDALAWGPFLFEGDPVFLVLIEAALR